MSNIRELKRQLDAELTKKFIEEYPEKGLNLAKICATELGKLKGSYYLKGGNAIAILKGAPVSGDWDFQYYPEVEVYNSWVTKIHEVDTRIVKVLETVAKEFVKDKTTLTKLEEIFCSLKHDHINPIPKENAYLSNKCTDFSIGRDGYLNKSYYQIVNSPKFIKDKTTGEGRLSLDKSEICYKKPAVDPVKGNVKPCIYVNYSIPGFILYRLAVRYCYELKKPENYYGAGSTTKTVTLKSELIDISVPRIGSAETCIAQEGIITNFFVKNNIRIPGWGYHLYENINLLQEIKLGISGSAHKKAKRIERGKESLNMILQLNESSSKKLTVSEFVKVDTPLKDSDSGKTKGFVSILTEMISDQILKEDVCKAINGRIETSKLQSFEDLVNFDIQWQGRPLVSEIVGFLKGPLKIVASTNSVAMTLIEKAKLEFEQLKNSTTFRIISPLLDMKQSEKFPLPFVLVEVKSELFGVLNPNNNFVHQKSGDSFKLWRLSCQTESQQSCSITPFYVRYLFIRKQDNSFSSYSINNFLRKTIIESQRMALAEAYQGMDL